MDIHDSGSILSNGGNANGQSAYVHDGNDNGQNDNMNIKQGNDNIKNSNLDPSNDTTDSCTQNDINTSNNDTSNSLASSNKASGRWSRVAKSTGSRVKSQVSGSSSPSVWSSPRVQSQNARGRHISDAVAVAALSSVSRQVSSSERRALQRVFSKK